KDDKGYISLKITTEHPWPMVSLVRLKGATPRDGTYFGPYTSATAARQMFDLIGTCFPLRQCSDEEFARRTRPCILYQIKRCCAPCVGLVSRDEYQGYVQSVIALLKGQSAAVLKFLTDEMNRASEALEFEKAGEFLERIKLLEGILEKQNVDATTDRDTDVWGMHREGSDVVVTKLLWRGSKLIGSHHFDFEKVGGESDELLESVLVQHYLSAATLSVIPSDILLSRDIPDPQALTDLIADQCKKKVDLIIPVRGEKKKLCQIAQLNAEATFKQRKDAAQIREKALIDMQEKLSLSRYPRVIDCFDNSHFGGTELVSSCVTYMDGAKYKPAWRKYRIRSVEKGDDYAMMKEVLERRYVKAKAENNLPDLIVIDGGKGHLRVAAEVLKKLDIVSCDLIAIAKEGGRHDKGQTRERIFKEGSSKPIVLDAHSSVLFLLQAIRDEAHRFVLAFQTARRKKASITSRLD
ncbi:MAG: excinuclease ABC subunit UvrC, partial [Verrucomicrobia bacterium]|nr:excinuclease ABC subunit UvrC [Verrucomicrobiota bacterium]